ncbi:MAG: hypothetical protein WA949_07970, partial [Phormidesmis sp.]
MTSTPPVSTVSTAVSNSGAKSAVSHPRRGLPSGWLWPLVWAAILAAAGAVSFRAVSVMTRNPPLPDCSRLLSVGSDSERLLCAQASVQSGSAQALVAAIEMVEPWQPSNPEYAEANRLMNQWAKALLPELEQMAQAGEIRRAIALAKRIPKRVEVYPRFKSAIATWDKEWSVGNEIESSVQQKIEAQNWSGARRDLQRLKVLNSNYWVLTRYGQLEERIDREETGRRLLEKARSLVVISDRTGDLDKLGEALAMIEGINLETAAWKDSKADINRWAERVLQYSFQKWEEEDVEAAIAIVQLVPPDLAVTPEAKDLLHFGHAQRLANDKYDQWAPSYGQIYNLLEAIKAVQQISPDSPFHLEAQDSAEKWQQKLDDMVQLQSANALAEIGQKATYQMAIAKAEQITQERPQRVQAQTLVSHWKKEIQRMEDRPILNEAVQIATKGGKANLRRAIAQAQKVEQGRALRIEGQTYIAEWQDRIEIIEDQPIMDKAEKLASKGDLRDAIAQAENVVKGRALYKTAQASIAEWKTEAETIEDRPILIRAESLAAIGHFSAAIDVAYQIAPGRALYGEALTSI